MPAAPSPAQSATSRLNGALSAGPITDAGKAASSANATRHGLRGGPLRLSDEETKHSARLRGWLARRLLVAEADLPPQAEAWVLAELKLARLDLLEMAARGGGIDDDVLSALPSVVTLGRYRARIIRERDLMMRQIEEIARTSPQPKPKEAAAASTAEHDALIAGYRERRAALASEMRTNEPDRVPAATPLPAPSPPLLNRHERRRLAALERRATS